MNLKVNARRFQAFCFRAFCFRGISLAMVLAVVSVASAGNGWSQETGPQLYFFTGSNCPPCRVVEPVLAELAQQGYPITKIDVAQYPQWTQKFQVATTPTVVLVQNNRQFRRHSGLINADTVRQWFAAAKQVAPAKQTTGVARSNPRQRTAEDTRRSDSMDPSRSGHPARQNKSLANTFSGRFQISEETRLSDPETPDYSTLHKGTRNPETAIENIAMNATVRLKVTDPAGISYATGTVIHCHNGEWLVLTCGHLFRDSDGSGKITAEFDFANGRPKNAPAELIHFDAKARDIALVAVKSGYNVKAVEIAASNSDFLRGQEVFTIGCDHGEPPTIRHSKIKNEAVYNGASKYDIYGRPVDGRSGGGMFTPDGRLIGVCNAAAVDYDEGIYTALETVHWELATTRLNHLFDASNEAVASATTNGNPNSSHPNHRPQNRHRNAAPNNRQANPAPAGMFAWADDRTVRTPSTDDRIRDLPRTPSTTLVGWESNRSGTANSKGSPSWNGATRETPDANPDLEVIVMVRSKSDPSIRRAVTLNDPSPELMGYLRGLAETPQQRPSKPAEIARLRREMPDLGNVPQRPAESFRAQSPDYR